ncbi:MAG: CDP-diacylglycerol--glycerol-3-phosphate 3-phosphatidyltransferase [Coriobacteriaceae bacterium]|nr:CDP-diacylglycerol--glycerol-3-phosphate 3-phosphatidyltransferase [Atopobium sp.]MCI1344473.1 CDP-diacylglycerol--glycerol-3-phosphate 3-phosphatidyltransferase [Atopobiaceae bacterium]RRF95838.1 MAG: CDP-diacylglycerol--glycerol-3-phosphate 3-phosphatidyltransferase [Coriobacteriaceae bacterium]MCI1497259.1 CDP-diacylglycerol--glycerol-3-phosphate 3-phosphatidyltransferase [Atopobiaceae bacterium]MCI1538935.1 CDP-diacylglycerol--glycerol-3-phosphate 3-phosphatidyltransferase [Atopobiaceae 
MAASSKKLWTPANIVTCIRIVLIPVWFILAAQVPAAISSFSVPAFGIALFYIAISGTDKLDGYLARSRNEVTTFGKFLDPIADKLVVIFALVYLLMEGSMGPFMLLVVIVRELLVSGLRMVVAAKGVVIAASNLGKAKTATTMVGICGMLLARSFGAGLFQTVLYGLSWWILVAATILTIWSGVDYLVKSWSYITEG